MQHLPSRPRRRGASGFLLVVVALVGLGCAGPARSVRAAALRGDVLGALRSYQGLVAERGEGDPDLLAEVALTVIQRAAESPDLDVRAAGFGAIRALGVRGRDMLEGLARRDGPTGDRAVAALYDLDGRRGRPPQRLRQAARRSDLEGRTLGAVTLRGSRGLGVLRGWAVDSDAGVRVLAAQHLGRFRGEAAALELLTAMSLHDADRGVRTVATSALGGFGADAVPVLRAVLAGSDGSARMSAPSALMAAAPTEAEGWLVGYLEGPVSAFTVECARALAMRGHGPAEDYLLEVMREGRRELRAQAAVGAAMLARTRPADLVPMLALDEPEVVLRVAVVLGRIAAHRAAALERLRVLARHPDGFVAVRALGSLGGRDGASTLDGLRRALGAPDAGVRRVAVMAWAEALEGGSDCDPLAPLLTDPDRSVALLAAVQIVLIAAR